MNTLDTLNTLDTFTLTPVMAALLAGLFTWLMTAIGAGVVFAAKEFNKKTLDMMLGFAGGVMLAASFWSLLAPAISMSQHLGRLAFLPAAIGFLGGALMLRLLDAILPHIHPNTPKHGREGIKTSWNKTTLLVLAITLHNIPEGLAMGVSFGAADSTLSMNSIKGAIILSIGLGLQNLPEGAAVSVPLLREGFSRKKAFMWGQLSAIVEPVFAVIGAYTVTHIKPILPYSLAFAAGAMVYVVVEEVIPESQASGNTNVATLALIFGFLVMMGLDVGLG